MKRRRDPETWLLVLLAMFGWMAVAAHVVAAIDRYSPFLSWQSAVVFGGAIVAGIIAHRCTKP